MHILSVRSLGPCLLPGGVVVAGGFLVLRCALFADGVVEVGTERVVWVVQVPRVLDARYFLQNRG